MSAAAKRTLSKPCSTAVLFEDLTGQGHTSRSVGGDRLTAIVPLAGLAVGCAGLMTGYVHRGESLPTIDRVVELK